MRPLVLPFRLLLSVFAASVTSIAAVAFVIAFDSAASVSSDACVTSLFFDLSSTPLVLSSPALRPRRATHVR